MVSADDWVAIESDEDFPEISLNGGRSAPVRIDLGDGRVRVAVLQLDQDGWWWCCLDGEREQIPQDAQKHRWVRRWAPFVNSGANS